MELLFESDLIWNAKQIVCFKMSICVFGNWNEFDTKFWLVTNINQ
jgi:hypothetical protein